MSREDRRRNQEAVYQAMRSYYEETKNWKENISVKEIHSRVNKHLRIFFHEEVRAALSKDLATKLKFENSTMGILILPEEEAPHEFEKNVLLTLNRLGIKASSGRGAKNVLVPWSRISYRTILRCLKYLIKEEKVIRIGKGHYTTDAAVKKREDVASAYIRVLSIDAVGLRGNYLTTLLGKGAMGIPFNPAYVLPEAASIFKKVYERRLCIHNDKETALAEANVWLNSFMNNVHVEIGTTGSPFKILSGRMTTSELQEIGPAILGAVVRKRVVKREFGVDALVFQSAFEIVFQLLVNLIDIKSLKTSEESDIVVKVSFNPREFVRSIDAFREPVESRLNRKMVRKMGFLPTKTYLESETREKRIFSEGASI